MSLRVFTFCDVCNQQGIRTIGDQAYHDRRNSDGRSWYEGEHAAAVKVGWKIIDEDNIVCPDCIKRGTVNLLVSRLQNTNTSEFLR